MASTNNKHLVNGVDEDPYKSRGYIEMKIANLTRFVQKEINSERFSAPVYMRGVPWRILAKVLECDKDGQKQKCLGYYLQCDAGTDPFIPFWSYSVVYLMKVLAQMKDGGGKADYCPDESDQSTATIFDAYETSWGYSEYMTFEDLMSPERGWYDGRTDSITLAVDLTVDLTDKRVCEYILIAENELKLDKVPINFSMRIGHMEWEINFKYQDQNNKDWGKWVVLTCKDMASKASKGVDNKVLVELFTFQRDRPKTELLHYSPLYEEEAVVRHLFTSKDNSLQIAIPGGRAFNNILFVVRVYKERSKFPDFTKPTTTVGRFSADLKLRVGDQQFHANKQMLSMFSMFFDRMFHGDYTAATQQEVELSLNTHSPELFHDFLLVLCVGEALPNSMNVAALFKLADFYDAEYVRQKCDHHLRVAREMCIEKRLLLARDYGSEETQNLIMNSISLEQSKRIINHLLMQNRPL